MEVYLAGNDIAQNLRSILDNSGRRLVTGRLNT
jgi:hypothetical protein